MTLSPIAFYVDAFPFKHWELDNVGNLRFVAPIARTGDLTYVNDQGEEYTQYVPPETLINSLDSFKTKAVTLLHPPVKVTPQNAMQYERGLTGYSGFFDGKFLWLTGTATDKTLIDSIVNGHTPEISPGYDAILQTMEPKKLRQALRDGNHVAAVPRGRNGRAVKFRIDSVETTNTDTKSTVVNYLSSYYLKDEYREDDIGNAPEQLYDFYRDEKKPKLFTLNTTKKVTIDRNRLLLVNKLITY